MAFQTIGGAVDVRGGQDDEGHRTYDVTYLVGTTSSLDGPAAAMQAVGLPLVGTTYAFSASEVDIWAWRRPGAAVEKLPGQREGEFPFHYHVTLTFSTKPRSPSQERPDHNQPVTDPLLEPQRVSGGFVSYNKLAHEDRFGKWIMNPAYEPILGPENEWAECYDKVTIEQNVPDLQYPLCSQLKNRVHNGILWGFPTRSIRFTEFDWSKRYGKGSSYYYTRRFTFEIRTRYLEKDDYEFRRCRKFSAADTTLIGEWNDSDVGKTVDIFKSGMSSFITRTITAYSVNSAGEDVVTLDSALPTLPSGYVRNEVLVKSLKGQLVGDWDRRIVNHSTKVLRGEWVAPTAANQYWTWRLKGNPDYRRRNDFIRAVDFSNNPTTMIIHADGTPFTAADADLSDDPYFTPHTLVSKYKPGNLLQLGIPAFI